ncbi:LamG-like jellyroll fold domain-containing protein [Polaribacter sp. IC073]|uniref:LamG-like jellyroll fold domain-containing protein n=1 Tax=Polaribacter sp. IC073 TaxID=2508540 RepID=UPI0011BEAEA5|nr:LamG-like jellyroll fold domain-containing protein [Polaribacter sp. IC073]TXD47898.1 T9SS type A sorting domain-containing protein [Polaribacter sp. IC073]
MKKNILFLFAFLTQLIVAQIPCSAGFTGNGTNDYITVPNTDAINLQNTRNRTIEFWFKPSDIATRQVLYEEGAQVNVILFYIEGGRAYLGGYRNNADNNTRRRFFRSAIGAIAIDKWTHISFTIEDTASPDITFKWFLDGTEQDSQAGLQVSNHSGNISLGRNGGSVRYPTSLSNANWGGSGSGTYNGTFSGNNGADNNFEGNISLFRIWNVARTETQIDTNKSIYLTTGTSLVAYQDGDQIKYEANGAAAIGATATAVGSGTTYTWNGGASTNFSNNANWAGTAPVVTKTQTVVITNGSNDPEIISEVKIGRLTINAGAEFTVKSGATLNVFYRLTNNGTITVEDGGALIFNSCSTTIAGSGTFNIKRVTPTYAGNDFYSYWSSPVITADSNISTVFPDAELIYRFDANSTSSDWGFHGTSNFNTGVGYAIQNEGLGGQLRTFNGKINEGDVLVNVFATSNLVSPDPSNVWSTEGDNLVGNPYASAIDWDLISADTDNSEIDGTVYLWNQNTAEVGDNNVSDYLQYNVTGGVTNTATGKIGSGQGFFIRTATNSAITFKTTHQIVANNTQFYKSNQTKATSKKEGRSWFTFNKGNKTNTMLVGFLKGATNRYDRLYDAPFDINQTSLGFYTLVRGNKKASIQGLPKLRSPKKVVKVGFIVDQVGEYSIGIQDESINEDYYIYLRDTKAKKTVDLKQREYTFNIDTIGENKTRFKIIYTKKKRRATQKTGKESLLVEEIDSKDFTVYIDGAKELIVAYDFDVDTIKEVTLYTIQGRKVKTFLGKETKNVSNLKTGIYIVSTTLINNTSLTKKILIAN